MNSLVKLTLVICMVALYAGCKKQANGDSGVGGKGGTNTLRVTPEHHGEFVDSCTIYIKYNTSDAPADGLYDDSVACAMVDTTPVATFTGLTKGKYYIFGKGYHATYAPPYIKGGLPVTIADKSPVSVYLPTYTY